MKKQMLLRSNGSLKRNRKMSLKRKSRQITLNRNRKVKTACMDQKKKKTFITGRR